MATRHNTTRFLLFMLFCFSTMATTAQSSFKKNDVYIELGGNSLFTAINYERQLGKQPGFGIRAGVGIYGINSPYYVFPLGVNYLFKLKTNNLFLELGAGASLCKADVMLYAVAKRLQEVDPPLVKFVPSLALRGHSQKNMMYRFSIAPVYTTVGMLPFFGISVGKRF